MMNWLKFPRWIPGWVSLYELVVWIPLCLDPSDGECLVVSTLGVCHTLNFCCFMLQSYRLSGPIQGAPIPEPHDAIRTHQNPSVITASQIPVGKAKF